MTTHNNYQEEADDEGFGEGFGENPSDERFRWDTSQIEVRSNPLIKALGLPDSATQEEVMKALRERKS